MTFLVALAMGTMYCVTVIQFIPEALGKNIFLKFLSWKHNLDMTFRVGNIEVNLARY